MLKALILRMALVASVAIAGAPRTLAQNTNSSVAGWAKYSANPVLGGDYGTCFDVSVLKEGDGYRMWFSWRPRAGLGLVESKDGLNWSKPIVVFGPNKESGWEDDINRPVVIKLDGRYHMWYTGQTNAARDNGQSWIGYATSNDGVGWKRMSDKPVLFPDRPWEKVAVMCPHVLWDEETKLFRMWYSGGGQREPDALGYATSPDGMSWSKQSDNPILKPDPKSEWQRNRVTGCQVIREGGWYVMFYIGFSNPYHAQIGMARSKDGITNWQQHSADPFIRTEQGKWDADACYKPYAIFDGKKWLLWYNGRRGQFEQIGVAFHEGRDLGF
jgi:beta-1,2-mannobiose phosphorylase / 1,2-beta-oligomannan phosphorylase